MHAGGEGVVGGLRLVDVIIREERLFAFADDLTCELVGTVGDDFVDVHVALRTRARLPDDERELIVELTGEDLIADSCDQVTLLHG